MKVFYDSQIFSWQKFGGISRYFVELISRMSNDVEVEKSIIISDNEYLKSQANKCFKLLTIPKFKGKIRIATRLNEIISKFIIDRNRFDILHPTYYDTYFLKSLKKPYVLTVHDMIHERFPESFPIYDSTFKYKQEAIRNATRIIAISNKTKEDIIDIMGINPDIIDVVYHGCSLNVNETQFVQGCPQLFILFTGQRGHYKNFERFINAFSLVNKIYPEIKLVCTGTPFNKDETTLINALRIGQSCFHFFVSDKQLSWLYKKALFFVFPSLYEGFGIPILEAFSCECPVLLSNTSCFPEIASKAAYYFDPLNVDSIYQSMIEVIEDEKLRDSLKNKGRKRLEYFSLNKMANETAQVYRKAIL